MSQPHTSGLRLRLVSGLFGAGLLAMSLLAIALLLEVRDAIYARRVADGRERLAGAVAAVAELCPPRDPILDKKCRAEVSEVLGLSGIVESDERCEAPMARHQDSVMLCEDLPVKGVLRLSLALGPVQRQLLALDARLLATLATALLVLVLLAGWVLERGVVRRLAGVDAALEVVGADRAGEPELLPEGGDELGRLGAAVNRLAERLREERARTQQQIVTLQEANRLLAEEKRALRGAREDLERSERLASVGRLAAGVAHEVGNPITAVIAYAALVRERLEKLEGAQEPQQLLGRLEQEAGRVDRILRDLLDLARPREVKLEPIDLSRAVQLAQALVEPQPGWKESGCKLVVELPGGLPRVSGEEHYVVQVLVNLLTNAAKAGAKTAWLTGREQEGGVVLALADDGRGVEAEHLARLFEPFFTTSAPGQGTGLGLALCHATMRRYGGGISARQREGGGAVFDVRFARA